MLEGYELKDGVIHQAERKPFVYNVDYVAAYRSLPRREMSALRYRFLDQNIKYAASVLDVGAGTGDFLYECWMNGVNGFGYDVVNYPYPAGVSRVDNVLGDYDLVTFFDSLEHMETLDILGQISCRYVCISLPWCHYPDDEWFRNWKHRKPDEHLWHFNVESLCHTLHRFGFKTLAIGNPEDRVRRSVDHRPNILTGIFEKV
jgi:SAM-dependent methyltransferase